MAQRAREQQHQTKPERAKREQTSGEREALSPAQARGGPDRPVEGITEHTGQINPDNAPVPRKGAAEASQSPARGGSEPGGMAGPVGYFEGEGNEGPLAPLGGSVTKSADDGTANSQGGVASVRARLKRAGQTDRSDRIVSQTRRDPVECGPVFCIRTTPG